MESIELQYKPDMARALERFEAWWHCELIDRPLVSLNVRPERAMSRSVPQRTHATLRDRWFDMEYQLDCLEAWLEVAEYLGESFPMYMPNLGPEIIGTLFGCELEFSEHSSWSKPVARGCAEILEMRPDFTNPYWQAIRDATTMSAERGRGKWLTGITDLHTNADLLAALRDPQELCLDFLADLDTAAAADIHVTSYFRAIYDDLYDRIRPHQALCTSWMGTLHAGRSYNLQSDFICMISPEQFEKAVLPCLHEEMSHLDRSIYHLDGPDALRHLDALLACPRLNGIQWVCGDGKGPATRWVDVYRRVQAAGKCVQVLYTDMDDARVLAQHIRPEGVWFSLTGTYSKAEAEDFLRFLERWAAGKRV